VTQGAHHVVELVAVLQIRPQFLGDLRISTQPRIAVDRLAVLLGVEQPCQDVVKFAFTGSVDIAGGI
jgi:hypothetical protein